MALRERIRELAGEVLRRVSETTSTKVVYFSGRRARLEHPDYEQLRQAYEQLPFIQRACELSTSFLFAGDVKLNSTDPRAREDLNEFIKRHGEMLFQLGQDAALYGLASIILWWDETEGRVRMRGEAPQGIKRVPRRLEPWVTEKFILKVDDDDGTVEQEISAKTVTTKVGNALSTVPNPYGFIPIVQVRERRRSGDAEGTGVITPAVYKHCEDYAELAAAAASSETYHGQPIPWVRGLKNSTAFATALADGSWGPSQMLELAQGGEVGFLETARGADGAREQLKILFHGIIVETGIPEYVWGVHMAAAQASTKEQRDAVVRHARQRRMAWDQALADVGRMALELMARHMGRTYQDMGVTVEWGAVLEADPTAEAETLDRKAGALVSLRTAEVISAETARKALPEVVSDVAAEAKLVESDRATVDEQGDIT